MHEDGLRRNTQRNNDLLRENTQPNRENTPKEGEHTGKEGDLRGFDEGEHTTKGKRVLHKHKLRGKHKHGLKTIRQRRVSAV